ncbi:MAG: enoyl-CoA hydratase-related protein [Gammaproteobacteria bacterium]
MPEPITFDSMTYAVNDKGIAVVTIDVKGQRMNVLTPELHRDVGKVAEQLAEDDDAVGAIFCSGKPSFVAGGDLKRLVNLYDMDCMVAETYERVSVFSRSLRKLETCGKPVAVIINGAALGGGLELALACHYRVVADDKNIPLGLPETTVGLMPGAGGTQRLPRLIGIEQATSLILSGRHISPDEALELGIVNKVTAAEQMFAEAERWLLQEGNPVQPWDRKGFRIPGGAGLGNMNIARYFQKMTTEVAAKTKYNYPAPITALKSIYKGTSVHSIDAALQIESRYFVTLSRDAVPRNMIRTLFLHRRLLDSLHDRPQGIDKTSVSSIALAGGGDETALLASLCDKAGINVVLCKDGEAADLATVDMLVVLSQGNPAVPAKLVAAIPATAIIAIAAEVPSIDDIEAVEPGRVIGWYLSFASGQQQIVEIVTGSHTSEKTLAQTMDFTKQLRKTPTVQKDSPLRFSRHCMSAYMAEGIRMLAAGINPALIENMAINAGMKTGPLALADSTGLDKLVPLLNDKASDELVSNMLKQGKGFYQYEADGGKHLWQGLTDLLPTGTAQPEAETVKQRLLCIQALAACHYWETGSIAPIDADLVSVLHWEFPSYTGGVLSFIDTMGVSAFVVLCEQLAEKYGELFAPSAQLRDYAAHSDRIYPKARKNT